jgi:hypothetical protein
MVRSALLFELIKKNSHLVVVFQTNLVPALLGTINKEKTMRTSTKPPSEMTSKERMAEIASILARGLSRFKNNQQRQRIERSSAGLRAVSKRSCDEQKSS